MGYLLFILEIVTHVLLSVLGVMGGCWQAWFYRLHLQVMISLVNIKNNL